ncbi:MAG: response regulator [Deltaproteobacteria bacterium]|nr:response regulator [Deltaproteobacteria bacterium]
MDDDPLIVAAVGSDLEEKGYGVTTADSGEKAIDWLNRSVFDLVITDLIMMPVNGIAVLRKAKEIDPDTAVIILTGFGDMPSAIDALRFDADDYLLKPCEPQELDFKISRCIERLQLKRRIGIYERMLSVCPMCKKIREDSAKGSDPEQWVPMETFLHDKAEMSIEPTYCPSCAKDFHRLGIDIGIDLDKL